MIASTLKMKFLYVCLVTLIITYVMFAIENKVKLSIQSKDVRVLWYIKCELWKYQEIKS